MSEFVELEVFDAAPYIVDLAEDEERWQATAIRSRSSADPSSVENSSALDVPASLTAKDVPIMPRHSPSQQHLPTPESTPPPSTSAPAPTSSSSTSRAKRAVKDSLPSNIDLPNDLPETGRTPLGIAESFGTGPSRDIGSAKLDVSNIVEGKRVRKPKQKFAISQHLSASDHSASLRNH